MSPNVRLLPVAQDQASILGNLLELYCHDLSVYFPVRVGIDGRFAYRQLPLYFCGDPSRFAYFTFVDDRLAGFALATRGSPATQAPEHLDVAEFFVLRSFRRQAIGERAAVLLWNELPGHWVVRVASINLPALTFWRRTIESYSGQSPSARKVVLDGIEREVFELDSLAPAE
jgi:predicted acetyltransferase